MKPFDLERAKAGDPIGFAHETAHRVPRVEFIRDDMDGACPILVRFRYPDAAHWGARTVSAKELVMLPTKRTVYAVVYLGGGDCCITSLALDTAHESKQWAEGLREDGFHIYREALPIEIEE